MKSIIPPKLAKGDKVKFVAPAKSLEIVKKSTRKIANQRFKDLGLRVSFGKHVAASDDFESSSVKSRVEDLHEAFADPEIKAVIAIEGGFNSNQLLNYLDWKLIQQNPKIFCGYSDITALNNAIFAKTGLITYSGPLYSSFGQKKHFEYTLEYFQKCVMKNEPYRIIPSKFWTDDDWGKDQEHIHLLRNPGPIVINRGEAEGTILGANLSTLCLLQGTEFIPDLRNSILFLEDDYEFLPHHFDRCLQALIQLPDFKGVKGLVWGRCEKASKMTNRLLSQIIKTKRELDHLPVIANLDFGHTNPKFTFPVGGSAKIRATPKSLLLEIINH